MRCPLAVGDPIGYDHFMVVVKVLTDILAANDSIAEANRKLFNENGIFVINLMSAPGAGKTTLLEKTLGALQGELKFGIVEGT